MAAGRRRIDTGRPRQARTPEPGAAPPGGRLMDLPRDPRAEARDWLLAELRRRLANLVRIGTIEDVDEDEYRVRVRYEDADESAGQEKAATAWIPWMTPRNGDRSEWDPPADGEPVVMAAPDGDLGNAIVIGSLYSLLKPPPDAAGKRRVTRYSDGAVIGYDADAHALSGTLPAGATAAVAAPGGMSLTGDVAIDGNVTATGNIHADGDVKADGDVEDAAGDMAEMRSTYNGHAHTTSQGPTGEPIQKMT